MPFTRSRRTGARRLREISAEEDVTVAETVAITKQTAEGVKSCQPILQLAQSVGVEMPITEQVVKVVTEGMSPEKMLAALMSRATKPEQGMQA